MSEDADGLLVTLRGRREALILDIDDARRELTVLEAARDELLAIIEIIGGRSVVRKKPGRKPGWRRPDSIVANFTVAPDPEPEPPPLGDAA